MNGQAVAEWVKKAEDNYGIDVRYPGFETTVSEAKEAVKAMKAVRKFMRIKLGLRN